MVRKTRMRRHNRRMLGTGIQRHSLTCLSKQYTQTARPHRRTVPQSSYDDHQVSTADKHTQRLVPQERTMVE